MMVERRTRQPGLVDAPALPLELLAMERMKALVLLRALLTEAVTVRIEEAMAQSQEVADDADHG
jgi:hypothetical protein